MKATDWSKGTFFPPTKRMTQILSAPKITTELILKGAFPLNFKIFLLELLAFRPIPAICPARGAKPKITGNDKLIPDSAHPAIKSVIFRINSFLPALLQMLVFLILGRQNFR